MSSLTYMAPVEVSYGIEKMTLNSASQWINISKKDGDGVYHVVRLDVEFCRILRAYLNEALRD